MSQIIRKGVKSLSKSGSTKLTDDVTLSEGSNITLTQTGNDIEIAASGGGGSGDVVGPAGATDNGIALFDDTSGKILKSASGWTISGTELSGSGLSSIDVHEVTTSYRVATDVIAEYAPDAGVNVDGVPIKDGLVDGRDVSADGSKLDGIESGADVTDATNVAAAGATMNTDTNVKSNSWVLDQDNMSGNDDTKVPTQQSVKAYVDNAVAAMRLPVGFIIMTGVSTNPSTLLGYGTWTRIQGRFIVGVSDSDTDFDLDDTGGAKTHTLTIDEMPSHTHVQNPHQHTIGVSGVAGISIPLASGGALGATNNTSSVTATNQNTGGGDPHNNMPPFIAKYIWQRTA